MGSTLNRVTLRGHLGKDPEIKVFQNGGKMANITLATSNNWQDKNTKEWKQEVHWHRIVVKFNDQLIDKIERECRKGTHVYIEGQLQTREYEDKNKEKRYVTEVVVTGPRCLFDILDKKESSDSSQSQESSYGQTSSSSYGQAVEAQKKPLDTNLYGYAPPAQSPEFNNPMIDDEIPF